MIPRPDLLDPRSPEGIEAFQLTDDPALPSCHIYMEAQVFTPDSRFFVLHSSAYAHGSDKDDIGVAMRPVLSLQRFHGCRG